ARLPHLVLVCGRYEGVDVRAIELGVDAVVSIGGYVLAGGELPALVVVEAVTRLLPGVMGNPVSAGSEAFQPSAEGPLLQGRAIGGAGGGEVSVGAYALAGGELPALVVVGAVTRLLPGVMGNPGSAGSESFRPSAEGPRLEGPQYTRPPVYRGKEVPEVLRS